VFLRRTLAVVALVYLIEGYPMGIFDRVWSVYFRRHDVSLAAIGFVSGLRFAWSAKVLWSPLVDRYGERRLWIAGANAVIAGALVGLAWHTPQPDAALWAVLIVFCLASATQDVAIDAYTIGLVERGREGPANSVRITAYRVAMVGAGGGLLLLARAAGWPATFELAALVCLAFAVAVLRTPRVEVPLAARREFLPPLRRWLSRPGAGGVFVFVLLYRMGDLALGPMLQPFWVDRGLSDAEIALVSTTLGTAAAILGAITGGAFVAQAGIGRALLVLGALALLSNLGYGAAAAWPGRAPIYAASLLESFCGGLASAAFLSYLMHICEKEHAAVQYALLTALYGLPGTFFGALSGRAVEALGYAPFFALTALLALPAFAWLPRARAWIDERVG
jgi:PAT family beta-lactamase induction signal transducer AmpG